MELAKEYDLHHKIKLKLNHFIETNKIPHIIFYGPNGSGKKTLLLEFINKIYNNDKSKINQYAMFVNCAHGKGISFIRDELKFFAKTNIHKNTDLIKSIILLNDNIAPFAALFFYYVQNIGNYIAKSLKLNKKRVGKKLLKLYIRNKK